MEIPFPITYYIFSIVAIIPNLLLLESVIGGIFNKHLISIPPFFIISSLFMPFYIFFIDLNSF